MPLSLLHKNGCTITSPGRFDTPMTSPRLLIKNGAPNVPPRPPRSTIFPSFGLQRNGSTVGTPVDGFATKLRLEKPTTSPRSLFMRAALSGPPSVPKSRNASPCQTTACVSVVLSENRALYAKVKLEQPPVVGKTWHALCGAF